METVSIYILLWLLHKFSNICKPDEGCYGQPKYCFKKKRPKKKNNTRCFKSALQWSLDFSFLFREGRSSGIGDDMLPFHLYIRRRGIWVPQPLATTQAVSYTLSSTTTGKEGQNSKVSPWYPSSEEPLPYFKNRGMWRGWARLKNWGPRASGCIGKSASIKPSRTIK